MRFQRKRKNVTGHRRNEVFPITLPPTSHPPPSYFCTANRQRPHLRNGNRRSLARQSRGPKLPSLTALTFISGPKTHPESAASAPTGQRRSPRRQKSPPTSKRLLTVCRNGPFSLQPTLRVANRRSRVSTVAGLPAPQKHWQQFPLGKAGPTETNPAGGNCCQRRCGTGNRWFQPLPVP